MVISLSRADEMRRASSEPGSPSKLPPEDEKRGTMLWWEVWFGVRDIPKTVYGDLLVQGGWGMQSRARQGPSKLPPGNET